MFRSTDARLAEPRGSFAYVVRRLEADIKRLPRGGASPGDSTDQTRQLVVFDAPMRGQACHDVAHPFIRCAFEVWHPRAPFVYH